MQTAYALDDYLALSPFDRLRTYLDEPAANMIPTVEGGEPLVDLREVDTNRRLVFAPQMTDFRMRAGAALRLLQAAEALHLLGYQLFILETLRPKAVQQQLFEDISRQCEADYPDLDAAERYRLITQFIADPYRSIPPHLTGGAVDLALMQNQERVDMGSGVNALEERSHLLSEQIPPLAQAQRRLLLLAMLQAGFAPMPSEWWHYSYGDGYWAAYAQQPQAIYAQV